MVVSAWELIIWKKKIHIEREDETGSITIMNDYGSLKFSEISQNSPESTNWWMRDVIVEMNEN